MTNREKNAQNTLVELIKYVFEHKIGLIEGITYTDLATRIGRLNKHGVGHAHGMGKILGGAGDLIRKS